MIPAAIKELKLYFVWDALTLALGPVWDVLTSAMGPVWDASILALGPVWDTSIDRGCSMGGWLLGSSQPSI